MSRHTLRAATFLLALVVLAATAHAQGAPPPPTPSRPSPSRPALSRPAPQRVAPPDLTREPTLYVVPYAHLDTQWRWDYPKTINEYLPRTMEDNFRLLDKYPNYVFNFSGANRYRMMKEYFPRQYAKVKEYVVKGRWFPAGSSMEENDVNVPSAESVFRQILYGRQFFRREFGKTSAEYMLPDCFGFPASLPSLLAHAGIKGFSTQKLSWKSAQGIPFNVGLWEGLDGKTVIAALNAMDYSGDVWHDLSKAPPPQAPDARRKLVDWPKRIDENGTKSGLYVDFHYYGTGDIGGSPRERSIALMEAIVTKGQAVLPDPNAPRTDDGPAPAAGGTPVQVGDGPVHVRQTSAEQMFLDIRPEQAARLPRYRGDLLLIEHSAGSITSQGYMKRWNRHNEVLADAAERASVLSSWLGARTYPIDRLNDAWALVTGGQFHDILPGTSIPKAYEYSWNDQVLALNQFAGVLTSAIEGLSASLDTRADGVPLVVFNGLNVDREDVVEALVTFEGGVPSAVRVKGPDGATVPAQVGPGPGGAAKVVFLARVPAVGVAVYDVAPAEAATPDPQMRVSETSLENARYRVTLDANGDVGQIFDKALDRELLAAPARLAFQTHKPVEWPAWNMDWADQQKPPRGFVGGPAQVRVVERGPARVAVEIAREAEGSRFVQTVRLANGDAGHRVEFSNAVDWKTSEAALKATFPLAASNQVATYNWDVGTIERRNNEPNKFEVPSHQWFDLTDASGAFGATILSDAKYGSDKPDDRTLRLTLIYTPGIGERAGWLRDQSTQDWGRHQFVYGFAGHRGDWRAANTDWQAQRLNQPPLVFSAAKHPGPLGKRVGLLRVSNDRVRVLAVKRAEASEEIVVRLVELDGKPRTGVRLEFAAPVVAARELNASEEQIGDATVAGGALVTDFGAYQPRTFAVSLGPAPARAGAASFAPVTLPYDLNVWSGDGAKAKGGFDRAGRALPAELLPQILPFGGVQFQLAATRDGQPDALVPRGQTIALPAGAHKRLYVLAASADGDRDFTIRAGTSPIALRVQDWSGYIGQWDNRLWNVREEPVPAEPGAAPGTPPRTRQVSEYAGLAPGYIKRAPVAWFASHRHAADGTNEPYAYAYLFAYAVDLPANTSQVTLPTDDAVRVLAMTVSDEAHGVAPAWPLYDVIER